MSKCLSYLVMYFIRFHAIACIPPYFLINDDNNG